MAESPWLTPQEVKAYTEIESVKNREDSKIEVDISRAEQYVINYTRNHFEDYEEIPKPVKTAVLLLSEAYAAYADYMKKTGGGALKSESFDDYSYAADDSSFESLANSLDLAALLDDYVIEESRSRIIFKMRRL